ncbi:hypothetical protein [Ahrensia sp. 13_GOM-1096m]|uniref:hypothetical protein n=1 Tax=Ahrensia sp. 13_GOM-1096m TaxID=1380380 RepID=UPI0005540C7F|nr:hypothetical protein [Ahrensia sp. 13_GOM-1096m]
MAEARHKEGEIIELVSLTDKQAKSRKARNIAIALCLVAFVGVFYVATVVKFGPAIMQNRGFNQQ